MPKKYAEYKQFDLVSAAEQVLEFWDKDKTFEKSVSERPANKPFVFYEGPPSANGMPGIHHVMSRTIKDLFCRYKTQKGFQVKRKAGWDTHGLPIELGVEKELGITKEDIGKTISIAEYNKACREAVMRYTDKWNELTRKMGYWVDMDNPYVTYQNEFIESIWWLLGNLYERNLLYKGYTIQPYSPAAGTGLSSHELNLPGCYKDVKDTSCVALFNVKRNQSFNRPTFNDFAEKGSLHIMAWTTTPWTLPSNTALTVGEQIVYVLVDTFNPYTATAQQVILAKNLIGKYFTAKGAEAAMQYTPSDKVLPYRIIDEFNGSDLVGITYHQLLPYALPAFDADKAFRVIAGDFVTTEDGTGVVHTAPTFGADDMRVAQAAGVPPLLIDNGNGGLMPLVDLQGRFVSQVEDETFGLANEPVKAEYLSENEKLKALADQQLRLKAIIPNLSNYLSVDERIALKLKLEGKAFKVEKYQHNYPHCWRTDKPVLYYPLDSWFIKSTAVRNEMIALNKTINWKPESTGTGRFGNWLENLNDWNLSRSRYWGTPLPIWRTGPYGPLLEECVSSIADLEEKTAYFITEQCLDEQGNRHDGQSLQKWIGQMRLDGQNVMKAWNDLVFARKVLPFSAIPQNEIDLHRPFVDYIVFFRGGQVLARETDLIDVWFDSGAMPFAQLHYPFENKDLIDNGAYFPADFIAEGVDQTRGWFYTLHAIAALTKGQVAYKNVLSNGLVLDKNGQKMSKRLGNAVDPFKTLAEYGPDATRWYMITNAQPWDNLKFDEEGIVEVQRKFFRALANTYAFFALYANVDGFDAKVIPALPQLQNELDKWIISKLNSLIAFVDEAYADYEPTKAGRAIQDFVVDDVSNWYVRLSRKRFWRGQFTQDKKEAYSTLYHVLKTVAQLAAPIAPFYSERLFQDLTEGFGESGQSVHIAAFPEADKSLIDQSLEQRMEIAQRATSLVLALRKKENIRVRQPLQKLLIPVLSEELKSNIALVEPLILSEVNVKQLEFIDENSPLIQKQIKANFKTLGPKYGKQMKAIAEAIKGFGPKEIAVLESKGMLQLTINNEQLTLTTEDVEISTQDVPGYLAASDGKLTVSLDITITEALRFEGIARELVNRIQNLRKQSGLEVTDRIMLEVAGNEAIRAAATQNKNYICAETLANDLVLVENFTLTPNEKFEIDDNLTAEIALAKS